MILPMWSGSFARARDCDHPQGLRGVILRAMLLNPRYFRVVLSYMIAFVVGCLCVVLNHVHVALSQPYTWTRVLQYPSGRFMLLCLAWAVVETIATLVMPREYDVRHLRLVLSYAIAAGAAAVCASLGHVHVAWRNPYTWSNVLQHKCGRLMLICATWALIEMIAAIALPRASDFTMQPASVR